MYAWGVGEEKEEGPDFFFSFFPHSSTIISAIYRQEMIAQGRIIDRQYMVGEEGRGGKRRERKGGIGHEILIPPHP